MGTTDLPPVTPPQGGQAGSFVGGTNDNRLLEQRSRLEFHYNDGATAGPTVIFIPFFENPKITENKAANYVTYNPIGRSSSLYAYTGAKSRVFRIEATYTLPHLANFEMGVERYTRMIDVDNKESQKLLFTNKSEGDKDGELGSPTKHSPGYQARSEYYQILKEVLPNNYKELGGSLHTEHIQAGAAALQAAGNSIGGLAGLGFGLGSTALQNLSESEGYNSLHSELKVIDTLIFFINVLRSSVYNNAANPIYGPPVVRIVHGTLFQSIPCICKSYNIEWEERMGYDLETLTPRQLRVTLNLEELRAGEFGKYQANEYFARDNLAGWESVISEPHMIDPGGIIVEGD